MSTARRALTIREPRTAGDETRDRIMQATRELLDAGRSFSELSISTISTAARVPRTTFYHQFDDKQALLGSLLEDVLGRLQCEARRLWLESHLSRDTLRAAIAGDVAIWREHARVLSSIVELAEYDRQIKAMYTGFLDEIVTVAAVQLRTRRSPGSTSIASPEMTARVLICMLERGIHQTALDASPESLEDLIESLTDVCWATLSMLSLSPEPSK
jgi:AcrR family transcriptional regulator